MAKKKIVVKDRLEEYFKFAKQHGGIFIPTRVAKFEKRTEIYTVQFVSGKAVVMLEVDYDLGRVTLRKQKNGDFNYVFNCSDPEVAIEVLDLLAFAARKGSELIQEYRKQHPSKDENKNNLKL